jgi:hypothetical protein
VIAGDRRWFLRISQNLTPAQVRAEHRLLARAGLPFAVPAPVPLPDGSTVAETAGGPATLGEWIPGVRPDLSQEAALERFGRAAAELSDALAAVPPQDAPYDWQDAPLQAPPDVAALARDLTAAGLDAGRAAVLRDGADRAAAWEGIAGRLPNQVVHADLAAPGGGRRGLDAVARGPVAARPVQPGRSRQPAGRPGRDAALADGGGRRAGTHSGGRRDVTARMRRTGRAWRAPVA